MQQIEISSMSELKTVVEGIEGDFIITLTPHMHSEKSSSRGTFEREVDYNGVD